MGRPSSWSPKSEPAEAGTAPGTNGMEPGFGVGNQAANSVHRCGNGAAVAGEESENPQKLGKQHGNYEFFNFVMVFNYEFSENPKESMMVFNFSNAIHNGIQFFEQHGAGKQSENPQTSAGKHHGISHINMWSLLMSYNVGRPVW